MGLYFISMKCELILRWNQELILIAKYKQLDLVTLLFSHFAQYMLI